MAKILCSDIAKKYGNMEVVRDFNLDIEDKEFVVFLGPSGSGKSTILRMIAGLEEISGGMLKIGEKDVTDLPPKDRGVAMVFQNYALYPHMNVYDNIAFGLKRLKMPAAEIKQKVDNVVKILGLEGYLKQKPSQLSGGQQQRVAIGRAMIKTPEVFLFDEPLSNLDAKLRHSLRKEIHQLHKRLDTTTVYVTHDQSEAMALADRIVLLESGNIEQVGSPAEIFNYPRTRFVADFIGSPSMNFMDGEIVKVATGYKFKGADFTVALDAELYDGIKQGVATLGMRPVHMQLTDDVDDAIAGEVVDMEYLGNENSLTVKLSSQEIIVVLPEDISPKVGEKIMLSAPKDKLHLFVNDINLYKVGA